MIIVSQDKTEIINFDNVNTLRVTKTGFIVSYENTYKAEDDCSNILGKYKTESRAKEVLNEIKEKYTEYAKISNVSGDIRQVFILPKVYEMPKE